jgi:acetyl-CoA carboxylase carboxyl transferase subunit alpha
MDLNFLDFEQPIEELKEKIRELRLVGDDSEINITEEIERLQSKCTALTEQVFSDLKPWQKVQLARHPKRPYTRNYINEIFTDFNELFGDRHLSQGTAMIGGVGYLGTYPVMVIGQQKGRSTHDKVKHNFGMPRPEEYQKALRLMKLAEKFGLPVITFIDTPGAYPGIEAEARNQSRAIAQNLFEMSALKTPIICTVIGEGGSGGALAIGVGDVLMMLQYSIYSVISPEGCATILWKSAEHAKLAAEAMGVTSDRIIELGLIDKVIDEPLGGAHRHPKEIAANLKNHLIEQVQQFKAMPLDDLLERRYERLMKIGVQ